MTYLDINPDELRIRRRLLGFLFWGIAAMVIIFIAVNLNSQSDTPNGSVASEPAAPALQPTEGSSASKLADSLKKDVGDGFIQPDEQRSPPPPQPAIAAPLKPTGQPSETAVTPAPLKPTDQPSEAAITPASRKPTGQPNVVVVTPTPRKPTGQPSEAAVTPAPRKPTGQPSVAAVTPAPVEPTSQPSEPAITPTSPKIAARPAEERALIRERRRQRLIKMRKFYSALYSPIGVDIRSLKARQGNIDQMGE